MGVSGRREKRGDGRSRRPFAALVADRLSLPLVYGRAAPKDYGTAGRVEGSAVVGEPSS